MLCGPAGAWRAQTETQPTKKHAEMRGGAIQHALLTGAKPTKLIAVKLLFGNAGVLDCWAPALKRRRILSESDFSCQAPKNSEVKA